MLMVNAVTSWFNCVPGQEYETKMLTKRPGLRVQLHQSPRMRWATLHSGLISLNHFHPFLHVEVVCGESRLVLLSSSL